jgi:hypothetical protein
MFGMSPPRLHLRIISESGGMMAGVVVGSDDKGREGGEDVEDKDEEDEL